MGYCSEAAVVRESCRRHAGVEFANDNVNRFIYFVLPTLYRKFKVDAETRFVIPLGDRIHVDSDARICTISGLTAQTDYEVSLKARYDAECSVHRLLTNSTTLPAGK